MKVWLRRAWKAAWRKAGPARLKTLGWEPARVWPPEIRVGGASPSQEPKCRADGKQDRSVPISLASTNTMSIPRVETRVRSTPKMGTMHRFDGDRNLIGEAR